MIVWQTADTFFTNSRDGDDDYFSFLTKLHDGDDDDFVMDNISDADNFWPSFLW